MVLFYKCCFCCLEIYIYAITNFIYYIVNSNLRKRNVAVHIIPVTAYNQLSERIAYFCDGVSKRTCYSVWIEEKAVNSYYYSTVFFVVVVFFLFFFCWKNGIDPRDEHTHTHTHTSRSVNTDVILQVSYQQIYKPQQEKKTADWSLLCNCLRFRRKRKKNPKHTVLRREDYNLKHFCSASFYTLEKRFCLILLVVEPSTLVFRNKISGLVM